MTRSRLADGSGSRLDTMVSSGLARVSVEYFRNTVMGKNVSRKIFGPENYLTIKIKIFIICISHKTRCQCLEPSDQRDRNDLRKVVIESKDNQRMYQLTDEQNYVIQLNQLI